MLSETSKLYLGHLLATALSGLKMTSQLSQKPEISVPDSRFGDYATNVALMLGKKLKLPPLDVANKIAENLKQLDTEKVFADISVAGGFINFTLSQNHLLNNLSQILDKADNYGSPWNNEDKTVIVEYFQLNIAKQPHVGHMRSAIVGDSIKRIVKFLGYNTLSDTHIGDWGTQFGIMIAAYKKYGKSPEFNEHPLEELEKQYVKFNQEMEQNPDLRDIGKEEFAKLEAGDPENRKLWQWFNDVSMKKFHEMVKLLRLEEFELHLGESFYEDKMQAILEELLAGKIAQTGEGGVVFVDLEEFGLGHGILKKSDGATTYLLRDLAKIKYVWDKYHYFQSIYVVDVRQAHHFRQLFKTALLAKWPGVEQCVHVDYGFVSLPDGILSNRKGNTINIEKVVDEAKKRALAVIAEKNPDLKNKEEVANQVGLAALKYFDLCHNAKSDIVFTWDKALSFEGNTGPYMQYTHARIYGILRKFQITNSKLQINPKLQIPNIKPEELLVLRKLNQFPEVLELVAQDFLPNLLCNYLFELSQDFNSFYQEVPVLQEKDEQLKSFRLSLITATAQVIKNGLSLLGIEAPEEM